MSISETESCLTSHYYETLPATVFRARSCVYQTASGIYFRNSMETMSEVFWRYGTICKVFINALIIKAKNTVQSETWHDKTLW